jgi:hypothetical protein
MQTSQFAIFTAAVLTFATVGSPVAFGRGSGMGGGPPAFAGPAGAPPSWHGSSPPGFSQGSKAGWNGGSVPPGWTKGKKTGWRGHNVPPGLYGR